MASWHRVEMARDESFQALAVHSWDWYPQCVILGALTSIRRRHLSGWQRTSEEIGNVEVTTMARGSRSLRQVAECLKHFPSPVGRDSRTRSIVRCAICSHYSWLKARQLLFFLETCQDSPLTQFFFIFSPVGKNSIVWSILKCIGVRRKQVPAVLNGNVQHYSVTLEQKVVFKKILLEQHCKSIVTFFFLNEDFVMKAKRFYWLLM